MDNTEFDYLQLLSKSYPSIQSAATEIINLKAILNLPKPTEHFLSDIHGEYEAFNHILRSASGVIKDKIDETFPNYSLAARNLLGTIIYYPTEKLHLLKSQGALNETFYKKTLSDLIDILKVVASKSTRSKVRKAMSPDFAYVIEELMQSHDFVLNKEAYYAQITQAIIDTGRAEAFIHEMSKLIQRLSVDHLHILGDIFDRGPAAYKVLDVLAAHHHCDVTWGNHDIPYIGAAMGNWACISSVIAMSCRYNTLATLEEGYGISLRPLVTFAIKNYANDKATAFLPRPFIAEKGEDYGTSVLSKMHKAIAVLAFKLESQLIMKHHEYQADYLDKWRKVDFINGTITLHDKTYHLDDTHFPTVDPVHPEKLTKEETELMETLEVEFAHSVRLRTHADFLLSHGSMYLICNDNLLFHGCIPMDEKGHFASMFSRSGQELLDYFDKEVRNGYYMNAEQDRKDAGDICWYLSCGRYSPIYGKEDILTFERYFIKDFEGEERLNAYYDLSNDVVYAKKILEEFNLTNEDSKIINGHMPVKLKDGESPVKADKKRIVIDGGICKAYQKVTGIAGYTLIYNSHGMKIIGHQMFTSKAEAVKDNADIIHSKEYLHPITKRLAVSDTDQGAKIQKNMDDLWLLLRAYRTGLLTPKE